MVEADNADNNLAAAKCLYTYLTLIRKAEEEDSS